MKFYTLLTLVFLFSIPSLKAQDVLWYGDPDKSVNSSFRRFDSGNFPKDYCDSQSNNASNADTTNDSEYGKVWRIRKPKGQKRGEFARTTGSSNNFEPSDGQTLYYGWRWKIASNPDITGGVAVWQWKTDAGDQNNTQNYPLNMGYGGGELTLSAWGPCYPTWNSCSGSISQRKTTIWSKSIPENTWVSFVIGIKLSRNDEVGYVELWYNGEKQILTNSDFKDYKVTLSSDSKRAYHKTMDGKVMYPKWGSYNSNACNFDITTYYDEMRIARTVEAATPSGTNTNENQLPAISFLSPNGNITVEEGYKLDVEVDASDPDGTIEDVTLYIDNEIVRPEINPPYEWGHDGSPDPDELNNLQEGTYTIKAVAKDDRGGSSETSFTLTVEKNTLSVSDISKANTPSIYPKPAKDFFTINIGNLTEAIVEMYTLSGDLVYNRMIRQKTSTVNNFQHKISPGIYLIRITDANGKHAHLEKLIIR